ncbi:hypothetical protein [Desulfomicrobium escambiense]|uniref:hypothetical protein n=1 Tax=Desulfomicrobium escambiense TaxID=29503 RepID=UPI000413C4E4|nr:hypothetical protein [Desulfomicrobium escambiense]
MTEHVKNKYMKKFILILIVMFMFYFTIPIIFEFYKKLGARKLSEKFSPGERYKVEYYIPLDYKYLLFPFDSPFFVKIYDFKEKKYIFESDVYEMGQGTGISWPQRGLPNIIVGTGIITHDLELEEYHAAP